MGIIKISKARELMGKANEKYSDEQIEEVINIFTVLSDIAIDSWIAKTPEQRKKLIEDSKKRQAKNESKK